MTRGPFLAPSQFEIGIICWATVLAFLMLTSAPITEYRAFSSATSLSEPKIAGEDQQARTVMGQSTYLIRALSADTGFIQRHNIREQCENMG